MTKHRWLLIVFPVVFPFVFAISAVLFTLGGCASDDVSRVGPHRAPTPEQVANRCLAFVATPGSAPPTEANLNTLQWRRYVNCKLGGNLFSNPKKVPLDTEATVSIRLARDGSIVSVKLLHSSGNDEYDEDVQRAIDAASPLPNAPLAAHLARIDMKFHPVSVDPLVLQQGAAAIGGTRAGVGLDDENHWYIQHCNLAQGLKVCD